MKCSPKKGADYNVVLSYSEGLSDLVTPAIKEVQRKEIIDLTSKELILHLPVSLEDEKIIRLFKSWDGNLNKYHIQISTPCGFCSRNNYVKPPEKELQHYIGCIT